MTTPIRLGLYAVGLVVAFVVAFVVGGLNAASTNDAADGTAADEAKPRHHDGADDLAPSGRQAALPGLAVSEAGFTLEPRKSSLPAGDRVPFSFVITGPDDKPVTAYTVSHEKELHLIVVRRDLAGYQHVHPTRAGDGTWSVPLSLRAGGLYRVFADFQPAALNRGLTLGTDVFVAGQFAPVPLPPPVAQDTVDDYVVSLQGTPAAGRETTLTFTVTKDGRAVEDLQPYLGAFGHLVSLRAGDLAYLHTHPAEAARAGELGGPDVRFLTVFPTAGSYRLFLDFRAGGTVRTAELTVDVQAEAQTATSTPPPDDQGHDH